MVPSSSDDHTVGRISLSGWLAEDSIELRKEDLLALVLRRKWEYPPVNGAREQDSGPSNQCRSKGRGVVAFCPWGNGYSQISL